MNKMLQHINNKEINKYYLGVFSIGQYNKLDIHKFNKFSLILFINNIESNLGHFVSLFKSGNKIYFCDSYGHNVKYYKKNIKNVNFYLKIRLQSNLSTSCGAFAIFFIHLISVCKFDVFCFSNTFSKMFKFKSLIKIEKYIIKYVFSIYPKLNKKDCKYSFCSKHFLINYKKCFEKLCYDLF